MTIVNFPEGKARPLFAIKDPEVREKILKNIASWLLTNRVPTPKDLKCWIDLYSGKRPECKEPEPCRIDVKKIEKCHGLLAICKTRNKGEPCEHFTKRPMNNNRECSLTGYLPGNMTQCPLDAAKGTVIPITEEKRIEIAAKVATYPPGAGISSTGEPLFSPEDMNRIIAAKIAHVPVESVQPINSLAELDAKANVVFRGPRPSDRTGPFTPASDIRKGLVDLNTPDTRTDPVTYSPSQPIERTAKDDRANGVVKQQVSAVHIPDLKVIPMEIRRAELRIIAQMVMYGVEDTDKAAAERMMQEGRVICEDLCERALNNQVEEEDSFEEVEA